MSTRSTIKWNRPDDAPGFHLFDDCMDSFCDPDGAQGEPPVYLELHGVEFECDGSGFVHVVLPRAMARELGLLPQQEQKHG